MSTPEGITAAASLFKLLSSEARLRLLVLLTEETSTVGALSRATELSQPLVSQHLKSLRDGGLVIAERHGREVMYSVTDDHVAHIVADAVKHVSEPAHTSTIHE